MGIKRTYLSRRELEASFDQEGRFKKGELGDETGQVRHGTRYKTDRRNKGPIREKMGKKKKEKDVSITKAGKEISNAGG